VTFEQLSVIFKKKEQWTVSIKKNAHSEWKAYVGLRKKKKSTLTTGYNSIANDKHIINRLLRMIEK